MKQWGNIGAERQTAHRSLPLGSLQPGSSVLQTALRQQTKGVCQQTAIFITLSIFHLLEGSQWDPPTPAGNRPHKQEDQYSRPDRNEDLLQRHFCSSIRLFIVWRLQRNGDLRGNLILGEGKGFSYRGILSPGKRCDKDLTFCQTPLWADTEGQVMMASRG